MSKIYKCCFCGKKYILPEALYSHMENDHKDALEGLPAEQVFFNYKNKYELTKKFGKSVISGKPTRFNLSTGRYERFANDKEKQIYREYFLRNMKKIYGKENLLTDPEQQKKMLANRSISGTYLWSDKIHEFTYTGTYEKKFLEFLDNELNWENPTDIFAPAPMIFTYELEGKEHFHIPDFYIGSLNLIISIKASDNKHYRLRDIETEFAQDKAILNDKKYNYLKIFDNNFNDFRKYLENKKEEIINTKK